MIGQEDFRNSAVDEPADRRDIAQRADLKIEGLVLAASW